MLGAGREGQAESRATVGLVQTPGSPRTAPQWPGMLREGLTVDERMAREWQPWKTGGNVVETNSIPMYWTTRF